MNGEDGTTTTTTLDVDVGETPAPLLKDVGLGTNVIPDSHILSLVRQNFAVTIVDVPPYVTDAQIGKSLREYCENDEAVRGRGVGSGRGGTHSNPVLKVFGTPVAGVVGCAEGMEPDEHRNETTSTSRIRSKNPSFSSTAASPTSPLNSSNSNSSSKNLPEYTWIVQ